jgi:hypothetical protein
MRGTLAVGQQRAAARRFASFVYACVPSLAALRWVGLSIGPRAGTAQLITPTLSARRSSPAHQSPLSHAIPELHAPAPPSPLCLLLQAQASQPAHPHRPSHAHGALKHHPPWASYESFHQVYSLKQPPSCTGWTLPGGRVK